MQIIKNNNLFYNNISIMKGVKVLLSIILVFCFSLFSIKLFWVSDIENDHTLIDCINWNDNIWVAFDSAKPYQSLKAWIENTISYINTNVNVPWNETTASGKVFNVKVNCTAINLADTTISLDFKWTDYNNELLIEWVWNNWLVIQRINFYITHNSWNIIFKNAKFMNNYSHYFANEIKDVNIYEYRENEIHPNSVWIKIIDSFLHIKNWNQIWNNAIYKIFSGSFGSQRFYNNHNDYSNQQNIENSIIEIEINWSYDFKLPTYIKNSKIIFKNTTWTWTIHNVKFLEDWNPNSPSKLNYSVLVSNEIDLWWNNFITENDIDIWFINNRFYNFNNFDFSWQAVYLNNAIENDNEINISNSPNLYNNVFKWTFLDTYDTFNMRKNYQNNSVWATWMGWIYKRSSNLEYFNINLSSRYIFKEITNTDIPSPNDSVYMIFQK